MLYTLRMHRRRRYALYCIVSLLVFAWFAALIFTYPALRAADTRVVAHVAALRTPAMTTLMLFYTDLGSALPATIIILLVALFMLIGKREAPLTAFSITILGALCSYLILKNALAIARPDEIFRAVRVTGFSFPSGHATMAAALYGSLALWLSHALEIKRGAEHTRTLRAFIVIVCALVALFIGASRVYLGAHFPADVVAGFALGLAWLYFGNFVALHHPHHQALAA